MDTFRIEVMVHLSKGDELCPVTAVATYLICHGRAPGPFFRLDQRSCF